MPVRVPEDMPKRTPPEALQVHAMDELSVLQHIALAYSHIATTLEGRLFLIFLTVSATLWVLQENPFFVMEILENCDDGPASDLLRRNMARVRLLCVRERILPPKPKECCYVYVINGLYQHFCQTVGVGERWGASHLDGGLAEERSPARSCASRRLVLGELRSHIPSQS